MKRIHLVWQTIAAIILVITLLFILSNLNIVQRDQNGIRIRIPSTGGINVRFTDSQYRVAFAKPKGWFKTGQDADIVLSAVDFNDSGGPLLFNHPGNIASDGKNLILADRNNNRVLIWSRAPTENNAPPDLVIGQKNFTTITPGVGLDELNWPVCVATDGQRLIVCDTQNHRVLVWNEFPKENGEPADMIFGGFGDVAANQRGRIAWPWAAWTDGNKLVITSTAGSQVLIWNSFPAKSQQPADIALRLPEFGTPRSIGTNGETFAVSDHNAKVGNGEDTQGTFFWKKFPTREDEPFDFFIVDPLGGGEFADPQVLWGMNFSPNGRFVALGSKLYIWDKFPSGPNDVPDIAVGKTGPEGNEYRFLNGDGSGSAFAGDTFYLSVSNGNKIVGYKKLPAPGSDKPDIVIGSLDADTNTLEEHFIISNPVPATDGKSLFVLSDFDRKLYVWKAIPDESGAHPDIVYDEVTGNDIAIYESTMVIAGNKKVYIWNTLPINGEQPDVRAEGSFGGINLSDVRGAALDRRYLYLADQQTNRIYVWEGIPQRGQKPIAALSINHPGKLSSDGQFLGVSCCQDQPGGGVAIFRIADIENLGSAARTTKLSFRDLNLNLPGSALVYDSSLFIAQGNNHIFIWNNIEDAIEGLNPDIVLGRGGLTDYTQAIGRDSLFMPHALAFDGSFLWVGEVKFSERLLRFSVQSVQ